jgi:hypothetical protein
MPSQEKWLPLHTAAACGQVANIKYLVQQGVDINGLDRVGTTTSSSDCCLLVNTSPWHWTCKLFVGLGELRGRFIPVADVVVAFACD